ncbi:MAG: MBL fold metallo-hydrolase [Candidatus Eisenbacteria bacterium]|uniref:MBL fold metallo-hydrolase n=1 Tax=Eiseniibacteriota bacterium TaxID=2212470 RepID=A0A538SJN1_UNCEI|nr:MAG: MBL fold metallo-hydrolase [Candidatus Eisenbacteria bacterium]
MPPSPTPARATLVTSIASAWTDLGGGIRVRQSVAYAMNSVLLLHPEHAIVVDPGVLPSELDDLKHAVDEIHPAQVTLFLTHAHWDHVLGRPWWPKARIVAHDRFGAEVRRGRERTLSEAARVAAAHGEEWSAGFEPFVPHEPMSGMRFAKLGPWRVVWRDAFGHCDSQLNLHLPESRTLIAGDMLSDIEIPWLNRPPAAYRATLDALVPLAANGAIETLIPGHGAIARGAEAVRKRIGRDLEYLDALESGVADARREGLSLEQAQEKLGVVSLPVSDLGLMASVQRENVRLAWEAMTKN